MLIVVFWIVTNVEVDISVSGEHVVSNHRKVNSEQTEDGICQFI
jgi:hypothetical protein